MVHHAQEARKRMRWERGRLPRSECKAQTNLQSIKPCAPDGALKAGRLRSNGVCASLTG